MGNSLFDQLRQTGLVDKNKAKQVSKQKHKQTRQKKGKQAQPTTESALRVQQARAEKVARDRELNLKQKLAAEKKAIAAQIKQLVEMNLVECDDGEIVFNFVEDSKVQQIYVTEKIQDELIRGRLAIIKMKENFTLVPASVAEKIAQREPSCVILCNTYQEEVSDTEDPYADYRVPDDLMW